MDILFPDNGLLYQLKEILTPGVEFHLFTNNYTPTLGDVLSSYTIPTWTGYASISQDWLDFTISSVVGHNGFAIAPPISWTNSGSSAVDIYGYFVLDPTTTFVLQAARFDGAPIVVPAGGSIQVIPTWGDFSQLSS
jgi:hypothetical protein